MNKKFSKTILSSAVAGLLLVSGGAMAEDIKIGDNYIIRISENNESARLLDKSGKDALLGLINTKTGAITTVNKTELEQKIKNTRGVEPQRIMESIRYTIDAPSLKKENINKLTSADLDKIKANVEVVSKTITSETAPVYREAIQNGMTSEDALAVVNQDKTGGLLKQFNGLNTNVNALKNATTFAIDENGEITDGQGVEFTHTVRLEQTGQRRTLCCRTFHFFVVFTNLALLAVQACVMLLQLAGVILDSLGVTAGSVVEADNSIIHTNVARCALVKCIAAIFILINCCIGFHICNNALH